MGIVVGGWGLRSIRGKETASVVCLKSINSLLVDPSRRFSGEYLLSMKMSCFYSFASLEDGFDRDQCFQVALGSHVRVSVLEHSWGNCIFAFFFHGFLSYCIFSYV